MTAETAEDAARRRLAVLQAQIEAEDEAQREQDQAQHIGAGLQDVIAAARAAVRLRPTPARDEAAERRSAMHDRAARLRALGVPAGAAAVIAADRLVDTAALNTTRSWLRERLEERRCGTLGGKRALVLAGHKDASKTTAASWALETWPWTRADEVPILVPFEQILGPWYHRPNEASPKDELTRLTKRDLLVTALLVLDDVGQESADLAERHGEVLDQLLKARCDADRLTIITTNYVKAEQLLERYGPRGSRIGERLTEFAEWERCPVEGLRADQRREQVLGRRRGEVARP